MKAFTKLLGIGMFLVSPLFSSAQEEGNAGFVTAASFLNLNSDVVSNGMGNMRNFHANNPYAISNNMAKAGYAPEEMLHAMGIGYTPLVRSLTNDVKVLNFASQHWIGGDTYNTSYLSMGIHYLGYGDMTYADNQGNPVGFHRPNEFSISLGYAKRLGEYFSLGITPKYVRSNLTGNALAGQSTFVNANSFAVDLSLYGEFQYMESRYSSSAVTYGLTVQNMGTSVDYKINNVTSKLPTNLTGGLGLKSESTDVGYLLGAEISYPLAADDFLMKNASKIGYAIGGELSFVNQFMVRAGYLKENAYRSNASLVTLGAGVKFGISNLPCTVNASYQMPIGDKTIGLKNMYSIGISVAIFDN